MVKAYVYGIKLDFRLLGQECALAQKFCFPTASKSVCEVKGCVASFGVVEEVGFDV